MFLRSVPAPKRGEVLRQIREALATKVRLRVSSYSFHNHHHHLVVLMCPMSRAVNLARSYPWKWARLGPRERARCRISLTLCVLMCSLINPAMTE